MNNDTFAPPYEARRCELLRSDCGFALWKIGASKACSKAIFAVCRPDGSFVGASPFRTKAEAAELFSNILAWK